jgi:hypothetical protein
LSDIGQIIADALGSKTVLEEAGKVLVESIPLRTRLGRGVMDPEGPTHPLPKLAVKTKSNRKLLDKQGKLTGPGATPAKSGLNQTGALLSGLRFAVGRGKLEVRLKDAEQEEKAQNVLKINPQFQFMNVSNAEMNRMIKAMSVKITEILNKIKFDGF